MNVRLAKKDDAAALARLHEALFPQRPWDEPFWMAALGRSTDGVLVIGEPPRGFAMIRAAAGEAELLTIGTTAPGQGDGETLLNAAISLALDFGAERLFLEVSSRNRGALRLYQRAGFARLALRPAYYSDGSDAEVMALNLCPQED
ncbi:MAG: GNAT family N-acetyltransferase [Pseudomonadota bacterium]